MTHSPYTFNLKAFSLSAFFVLAWLSLAMSPVYGAIEGGMLTVKVLNEHEEGVIGARFFVRPTLKDGFPFKPCKLNLTKSGEPHHIYNKDPFQVYYAISLPLMFDSHDIHRKFELKISAPGYKPTVLSESMGTSIHKTLLVYLEPEHPVIEVR